MAAGASVKRLRYMFDRVMKFFVRGCKYDWLDSHLDFEVCKRCDRAKARKARIESYRTRNDFPTARTLT